MPNITETNNYGEIFICDCCGSECVPEYDDDGVITNGGGVVVGSTAYCPDCCDKWEYYKDGKPSYDKFQEDIENGMRKDSIIWFDRNKSFKENGREFRIKRYGTPDLITQFVSFDTDEDFFNYLNGGKDDKKD